MRTKIVGMEVFVSDVRGSVLHHWQDPMYVLPASTNVRPVPVRVTKELVDCAVCPNNKGEGCNPLFNRCP